MNALPDFYAPQQIGRLIAPNTAAAVSAGLAAGLSPAQQDTRRVMLLLVDPQIDFIHPDGALCVPGAVEDTRRTVEWIYRHAGSLTTIAASLDSHLPGRFSSPPGGTMLLVSRPPFHADQRCRGRRG